MFIKITFLTWDFMWNPLVCDKDLCLTFFLLYLIHTYVYIYFFVCVGRGEEHLWRSEECCQSQFFLCMWVPGTKFRLSSLVANTFTHSAISIFKRASSNYMLLSNLLFFFLALSIGCILLSFWNGSFSSQLINPMRNSTQVGAQHFIRTWILGTDMCGFHVAKSSQ